MQDDIAQTIRKGWRPEGKVAEMADLHGQAQRLELTARSTSATVAPLQPPPGVRFSFGNEGYNLSVVVVPRVGGKER